MGDLQREVDMPMREIEQAVEILKRKGMVSDVDGDRYRLTSAGVDQTEDLWSIAREQQNNIFSRFSPDELSNFKTMLKALIAGC
jgi:DNA-binding MarR family transcriptional regulator